MHYISKKEIEDFCAENTTGKIGIIWIGHATLLVSLENQIILMDPMFSERFARRKLLRRVFKKIFPNLSRNRASPFKFAGPKRYRPVPISIQDIPRVDAVVISHNHYDHLSIESVEELNKKFGNNGLQWFMGRGLAEWFKSNDMTKNVHELNWWESKKINGLEYFFVPAQHWSSRGVFDRNKVTFLKRI